MELNGLIVGLGNPGKEYASTRHNYGFMLVEALVDACARLGQVNKLSGQKDPYCLWRCSLRGRSSVNWLVATPLTFMNRSGEAVQRISAYYHIDPDQILVLHDELDLALGRMKLKIGGGHAGHNGIRSIQQMLGTPDFYRLRLGIGKPAGHDSASYVLGRFSAEQQSVLAETILAAVEGALLFMKEGMRPAQQFCNGFIPESERTAARASDDAANKESRPPAPDTAAKT